MLFSDLNELKSLLELDPEDTSEDKNLNFYLEWATKWICEILNRPDFTYKSRTEIYKATNTPKICLRFRPVHKTPTPVVVVDDFGYFGAKADAFTSTPLVFGEDFTLQFDQEEADKSRSGILIRIKACWERPTVRRAGLLSPYIDDDRGSVKVTYTGGYTVDDLPAPFRMATITLISRLRYLFPVGMGIRSESYEERSVSYLEERKDFLLSMIKPMIYPYRNWKF